MIKLRTYTLPNNITLSNKTLETYINNFWNDIFSNIKDSHLLIMCKINFSQEEMSYRTLGNLRKVNYEDKDLFIEYLSSRLSYFNDSYVTHPISEFIFSYIIKEGKCVDNKKYFTDLSDKPLSVHNFNNLILPITMIPSEYGEIQSDSYITVDGIEYHRFIVVNDTKVFRIDRSLDRSHNIVTVLGAAGISWVDTCINNSTNIFKRDIKNSTIYFMDGERVLRKQILPAKAFRKLSVDSKGSNTFYTLDIETIKKAGKLIPYLICAYDGIDYITSYTLDQKSLFKSFLDQLLSKLEAGTTIVYAHNLSGFDGVFLLRQLLPLGKVDPLIFKGKIISIKVKIGNKKSSKTIIFKDSYLLLPLSLRHLCKAFDTTVNKGIFPFLLSDIYYSGVLPALKFWSKLSPSIYESLVIEYKGKKMWSFQIEAIKYCKLDCQSLHEVITKFNELIYKEFKIDSHTVLTLPSLAMKIYKTHYMPDNSIYQLLGKAEEAIRSSYTGGACDVYIPHNRISSFFSKVKATFIKLYYYDVNSLYPYVMLNNPMPPP